MSVNSEMTAIADLIRGLRGVSGKMGLDAMKGHLQDEQDGLDSALAALSEKGVEVPAGTKVDGLAALIAAIEAGGGGGVLTTTTGDITPSETTNTVTVAHGLGKVPIAVVIRPLSSAPFSYSATSAQPLAMSVWLVDTMYTTIAQYSGSNATIYSESSKTSLGTATASDITFITKYMSRFMSGKKYRWVAVG